MSGENELKNNNHENMRNIEDLGLEAEQLAAMSLAIEDAIAYGPFTEKAYHGALSLLSNLLNDHAKKIYAQVDAAVKKPCGTKEAEA
jgi:hypothetical protein